MGGSLKCTCASLPATRAPSKMAPLGSRTSNFACELTTTGSWKLEPMRSSLIGTHVTPRLPVGAKIGPTRKLVAASYSGCSGAATRRSGGLTLNVTLDWKNPTSAPMPTPKRSCSIGLYATQPPSRMSAEPSNEPSA